MLQFTASDIRLARRAIELFTYHIATQAASIAAALGGLDGLVFTARVGQHAPAIRTLVCDRLAWLGIRIDTVANQANSPCISTPDSPVEVHVLATDEEVMIARHTQSVIQAAARPM